MKSEDFIWRIFGVPSMKALREEDNAIEEYFFNHDYSKEQIFEYNQKLYRRPPPRWLSSQPIS